MTSSSASLSPGKSILSSPWLRWGLVALIQLGLIALPLVDRLQVQTQGRKVTLELVPVDPRDLLRGEYVILNLASTTLSRELPGGEQKWRNGQTVFVTLEVGSDGIARPVKVSANRKDAGEMALRGEVKQNWNDDLRVQYGLDAFFLPEGAGKVIEQLPRERVKLVIALHEDGRSMPLRLLIDGKPFESDGTF